MLDYLRLGTFNSGTHALLMSCLPKESRKATHWLQYAGMKGDHTFAGAGDQHGRRHFITHCSGELANTFFSSILLVPELQYDYDLRCRRIDLKRDIRQDLGSEGVYDAMMQFHQHVTRIVSEDGWTVYGNQRSGDFMIRIYRKYERELTRCEFECKGKLAEEVWSWLYGGQDQNGIYRWLLDRAKVGEFDEYFRKDEDPDLQLIRKRIDPDIERRLEWMFQSFSGIEKLIMDHQSRDRALDALLLFASRMRSSSIQD